MNGRWPLLLVQREDDWTWLWFLLFIVLPIAARLLRRLLGFLGLLRPEPPDPAEEAAGRRAARRSVREEQRRAEAEGEDLWRRLMQGEEPEPPREVAVPAPVSGPAARIERERSFEREEEPVPLAVLGEVSEPAEAAETSLEREEEPVPLDALARAPAPAARAPVARAAPLLARGDLRRAVLYSEILGSPLSLRRPA